MTRQDCNSTDGVAGKLLAIDARVAVSQFLGANNKGIPHSCYVQGNPPPRFHFQGVQRWDDLLFVSTGHDHRPGPTASQIIIVKMETRPAGAAWSVPYYFPPGGSFSYASPHPDDRVLGVVDLSRRMWHAGGIQRLGDRIAVPVYCRRASKVLIYRAADLAGPCAPGTVVAPTSEIATEGLKPRAVALACLPRGTPLAIVWDDAKLHFYRECGRRWVKQGAVDARQIQGFDHQHGLNLGREYQNINLLLDTTSPCPLFYLLAFRNDAFSGRGNNCLDVYAFSPSLDPTRPVRHACPRRDIQGFAPVRWLNRRMGVDGGQRDQYSFSAAAGVHLLEDGGLLIYSAAPKLLGGGTRLNFNEFAKR